MPVEGAMADIVKYHGCLITVHSGAATDGNGLGSYEIRAYAPETVAAFAKRSIIRLCTTVAAGDLDDIEPRLPVRDYLVEMAKKSTLFWKSPSDAADDCRPPRSSQVPCF